MLKYFAVLKRIVFRGPRCAPLPDVLRVGGRLTLRELSRPYRADGRVPSLQGGRQSAVPTSH